MISTMDVVDEVDGVVRIVVEEVANDSLDKAKVVTEGTVSVCDDSETNPRRVARLLPTVTAITATSVATAR